ncbi:bcl-2 homologous antagonist/killer-like [Hydra vulgaris]|uniref:Bak n=1 Tax=Hydra vulgaris TaxID=6087 RepID=A1E3K5_HYDVU|nr:bcl-2 homologous antagonist/killer-like [Hydra vulgaris]ABL01492.1 bak [Hydra vulgaris]
MAEAADDLHKQEEQQVANDTEKVFCSFVYKRLTSEIDKESSDGSLEVGNVITNLRSEVTEFRNVDESNGETENLGRVLASFGDEINDKYRQVFSDMLCRLNIETEDVAYETFANIARRLFENGINWGRIVALLCFGYEVAFAIIKRNARGFGKFLRKLIRFVVDFIVNEKIAKWIAKNGGWLAALVGLKKVDDSSDVWFKRIVILGSSNATVYMIHRRTR